MKRTLTDTIPISENLKNAILYISDILVFSLIDYNICVGHSIEPFMAYLRNRCIVVNPFYHERRVSYFFPILYTSKKSVTYWTDLQFR